MKCRNKSSKRNRLVVALMLDPKEEGHQKAIHGIGITQFSLAYIHWQLYEAVMMVAQFLKFKNTLLYSFCISFHGECDADDVNTPC
jgi:hypothetical protein